MEMEICPLCKHQKMRVLFARSFSDGEYLMCLMLQNIALWEGLSSQQKTIVNMNDGKANVLQTS